MGLVAHHLRRTVRAISLSSKEGKTPTRKSKLTLITSALFIGRLTPTQDRHSCPNATVSEVLVFCGRPASNQVPLTSASLLSGLREPFRFPAFLPRGDREAPSVKARSAYAMLSCPKSFP